MPRLLAVVLLALAAGSGCRSPLPAGLDARSLGGGYAIVARRDDPWVQDLRARVGVKTAQDDPAAVRAEGRGLTFDVRSDEVLVIFERRFGSDDVSVTLVAWAPWPDQ